MGEDAGALRGVAWDGLEAFAAGPRKAVVVGQPLIEDEVVGLDELAVVGGFGGDDAVHEELEGLAEVGDDLGVEAGEGFGVFTEVAIGVQLEPAEEEVVDFGAGAGVGGEALGMGADLLWGVQFMGEGGGGEDGVWQGIVELQREAGGDGEVVLGIAAKARVEEARGFEDEEDGAFHGGIWVRAVGEGVLDVELALMVREGAAEGAGG